MTPIGVGPITDRERQPDGDARLAPDGHAGRTAPASVNVIRAWPRSTEEIASELERVVTWRKAVERGSPWLRATHEDFGRGLWATMSWCLGMTLARPTDGARAQVSVAEINDELARALRFAAEEGEHWEYGFGALLTHPWVG